MIVEDSRQGLVKTYLAKSRLSRLELLAIKEKDPGLSFQCPVVEMQLCPVAENHGRVCKAVQVHNPSLGGEERARQAENISPAYVSYLKALQICSAAFARMRLFGWRFMALQGAYVGGKAAGHKQSVAVLAYPARNDGPGDNGAKAPERKDPVHRQTEDV